MDQDFSGEDRYGTDLESVSEIAVLLGKGGVGKSTVAVNLAVTLAQRGLRVGQTMPTFTVRVFPSCSVASRRVFSPAKTACCLCPAATAIVAMSIKYFLHGDDDAVVWRGPLEYSSISCSCSGQTEWGDLDYLIIEFPPGTGDEPLSVLQLVPNVHGALVGLTTPQDVALADVRRSIHLLAGGSSVPILGVVENMSFLVCPHCGLRSTSSRVREVSGWRTEMAAGLVARVPLDPRRRRRRR